MPPPPAALFDMADAMLSHTVVWARTPPSWANSGGGVAVDISLGPSDHYTCHVHMPRAQAAAAEVGGGGDGDGETVEGESVAPLSLYLHALKNKCYQRHFTNSYWAYELCFHMGVRQWHPLVQDEKKSHWRTDFSLGYVSTE